MFLALLETARRKIDGVRRVVTANERIRVLINDSTAGDPVRSVADLLPDNSDWRQLESSSGILILYAALERFAEDLISDYLSELTQLGPFSKLPERLQKEYRNRFGQILVNLDTRRHQKLRLEDLVCAYADCLKGTPAYKLEPRVMVTHSENFRFPILNNLFQSCGLEQLEPWMASDNRIARFVAEKCGGSATVASELQALVELRNDAAHGVPYPIPSPTQLTNFCDFVMIVCCSLHDYVTSEALDARIAVGKARVTSLVKESFRDGIVAIGDFENCTLEVGETLYFKTAFTCTSARIESLQLDGVETNPVNVAVNTEVGIRLNGPVRKDSQIIKML